MTEPDLQTAADAAQRVLLVDDDPDYLALVALWLSEAGFVVDTTPDAEAALARIDIERPAVVVSDVMMEGYDGLRLLSEIHRRDPIMPVVLLTGSARIPDAVKAAHLGVSAFLTKPIEAQALVAELQGILRVRGSVDARSGGSFGAGIIFRSAGMHEVVERARMVAQFDTTVLLTGETGTGKEVLAKAIHEGSPRAAGPFVSINCGAIPEQLLESELFGHEKGAFTGASARHTGLFQAADGGTLFLDEIGDMPLALQAKLLRVLQEFEVRPVGATRSIPIDVRVISATHRDLKTMVEDEGFRGDLYYRLNVVPLQLPPLRDRREDILPLVDFFLERLNRRVAKQVKRFAPDARETLLKAGLPGNIRQLQNLVERCYVLSGGDMITAALVGEALDEMPGDVPTLDAAKQAFERRYLLSLLRTTAGNVATAARLAGRNRTEFYKLLDKHGLEPKTFREQKA